MKQNAFSTVNSEQLANFIALTFAFDSMMNYRKKVYSDVKATDFVACGLEYVYFGYFSITKFSGRRISDEDLSMISKAALKKFMYNEFSENEKVSMLNDIKDAIKEALLEYDKTESYSSKIDTRLSMPYSLPAFTSIGLFQQRLSVNHVPMIDLVAYDDALNLYRLINSEA